MAKMFEVTIQGTYQQQMVVNRLTFVSDNDSANTATAFGLLRALGMQASVALGPTLNTVLDLFLGCQTDLYQATQIMSRNLFGDTDFYTAALSGDAWNGHNAAGADGSPSFIAAKLQTNRVNQSIGRGTLALTPLGEENYLADGTLTVDYLNGVNALCTALNAPPTWTDGTDTTQFFPAVLQKQEYDVPDSDPVRKAYRYYTDPAVQLEHAAYPVQWFPKSRVTSQTSRRIGKGA